MIVTAALIALLIVACGSEPDTAPASGLDAPVVTPTPSILSELVALRIALDRKDGHIYSQMEGEPSAVWGTTMTYGEAVALMGSPISPDTSEYARRDDLVWYFVLEGQVIFRFPAAPGSATKSDPSAEASVVGMAFDAFTGSALVGTSGPAPRDLGQSQLPKIDVPNDIYDIVLPTPVPRSAAPAVTAAPPATAAPMAPAVSTPAASLIAPTPPTATAAPVPITVIFPPVVVPAITVSSPTTPPEPGVFESALRFVPDKPEHRGSMRMNDLEGLRRVLGIEAPGPDADQQAVLDYKFSLVLSESIQGRLLLLGDDWLSGFSFDYLDSAPSTRPFLGFDSRDIDLIVGTGPENESPTRGLEMVIGDIRAEVAETLLFGCEVCVPHEIASHSGIEFFTWGEDARPSLSDRLAPPAHDQLGRGGRILIGDGYAVRTLFTESMREAIDVISGAAPGLSENGDFIVAARAADEMGAVSLTLTSQPFRSSDITEVYAGRGRLTLNGLDHDYRGALAALNERSATPGAREALVAEGFARSGSLPAFEVVATGLGSDAEGVFVALALVFKDDAIASDAAAALKSRIETGVFPDFSENPDGLAPWNEQIESAEIDVNGRTVRVLLRVRDPGPIQQNFVLRSNGGFAGEGVGVGTLTLFLIAHD